MFEQSLLETTPGMRARRRGLTLLSFVLEALAIALLVLVPLLYTDALPVARLLDRYVELPLPPGGRAEPDPTPPVDRDKAPSEIVNGTLIEPKWIPPVVPKIVDQTAPAQVGGRGPGEGIVGMPDLGQSTASTHPVLRDLIRPRALVIPSVERKVLRISHMDEGRLVHRVTPVYPPLAVQTRTQGAVVLQAAIGRDGRIQNLRAVSGHPMLIPAAIDAVKQWRYRPYMLNGEAVEVETQITVNFRLSS